MSSRYFSVWRLVHHYGPSPANHREPVRTFLFRLTFHVSVSAGGTQSTKRNVRSKIIASVIGIVVFVVIMVVLFAVPFAHTYSDSISGPNETQLNVPSTSGVSVTVTWSSVGGSICDVFVSNGDTSSSAAVVVSSYGTSGVLTFTTNSGSFWLFDATPYVGITYTVSYSAPLISP